MRAEQTSKRVGRLAARGLRTPESLTPAEVRSVSASAATQAGAASAGLIHVVVNRRGVVVRTASESRACAVARYGRERYERERKSGRARVEVVEVFSRIARTS